MGFCGLRELRPALVGSGSASMIAPLRFCDDAFILRMMSRDGLVRGLGAVDDTNTMGSQCMSCERRMTAAKCMTIGKVYNMLVACNKYQSYTNIYSYKVVAISV